jgi:hypothetical protein
VKFVPGSRSSQRLEQLSVKWRKQLSMKKHTAVQSKMNRGQKELCGSSKEK